jgi:hypothetical protein
MVIDLKRVSALRRELAELMATRFWLESQRGQDGVADKIKQVDGSVTEISRAIYDAERGLRPT